MFKLFLAQARPGPVVCRPRPGPRRAIVQVQVDELKQMALMMTGVDGIPPKLLKEIVEQISTTLAKVFNLSLEEGIVPSEWKDANSTHLFKGGLRNKSDNYRPVSLTSLVCKLLETLKNISTWVRF